MALRNSKSQMTSSSSAPKNVSSKVGMKKSGNLSASTFRNWLCARIWLACNAKRIWITRWHSILFCHAIARSVLILPSTFVTAGETRSPNSLTTSYISSMTITSGSSRVPGMRWSINSSSKQPASAVEWFQRLCSQ